MFFRKKYIFQDGIFHNENCVSACVRARVCMCAFCLRNVSENFPQTFPSIWKKKKQKIHPCRALCFRKIIMRRAWMGRRKKLRFFLSQWRKNQLCADVVLVCFPFVGVITCVYRGGCLCFYCVCVNLCLYVHITGLKRILLFPPFRTREKISFSSFAQKFPFFASLPWVCLLEMEENEPTHTHTHPRRNVRTTNFFTPPRTRTIVCRCESGAFKKEGSECHNVVWRNQWHWYSPFIAIPLGCLIVYAMPTFATRLGAIFKGRLSVGWSDDCVYKPFTTHTHAHTPERPFSTSMLCFFCRKPIKVCLCHPLKAREESFFFHATQKTLRSTTLNRWDEEYLAMEKK